MWYNGIVGAYKGQFDQQRPLIRAHFSHPFLVVGGHRKAGCWLNLNDKVKPWEFRHGVCLPSLPWDDVWIFWVLMRQSRERNEHGSYDTTTHSDVELWQEIHCPMPSRGIHDMRVCFQRWQWWHEAAQNLGGHKGSSKESSPIGSLPSLSWFVTPPWWLNQPSGSSLPLKQWGFMGHLFVSSLLLAVNALVGLELSGLPDHLWCLAIRTTWQTTGLGWVESGPGAVLQTLVLWQGCVLTTVHFIVHHRLWDLKWVWHPNKFIV